MQHGRDGSRCMFRPDLGWLGLLGVEHPLHDLRVQHCAQHDSRQAMPTSSRCAERCWSRSTRSRASACPLRERRLGRCYRWPLSRLEVSRLQAAKAPVASAQSRSTTTLPPPPVALRCGSCHRRCSPLCLRCSDGERRRYAVALGRAARFAECRWAFVSGYLS